MFVMVSQLFFQQINCLKRTVRSLDTTVAHSHDTSFLLIFVFNPI